MLQTIEYRGRQIVAENIYWERGKGRDSRYVLRNLKLVASDIDISVQNFVLGDRGDRWDSWSAWDSNAYVFLLGDFAFLFIGRHVGMDPNDHHPCEKMSLLTESGAHESNQSLIDSAQLLQDYTTLEHLERDKRRELSKVFFASSCSLHVDPPSSYRYRIEVDLDTSINRTDAVLEESVVYESDPSLYTACSGAARVLVNEEYRWLVPHPDGPSAALARLRATSSAEDWTLIQPLLDEATESERTLVFNHFVSLLDVTEFWNSKGWTIPTTD